MARWKQFDPVYQPGESPYVSMGNNPVAYNDVLGNTTEDWFKNLVTGEVKWDDTKGKKGDHVSLKGSSGAWENLGEDQYSDDVVDAVGADIMQSPFLSGFLKYFESAQFGESFFFRAANRLDRPESGFMKELTNNSVAVNESINLSILTHKWVDAGGWTEQKNSKEHFMGMFLLSSRYGTMVAESIGIANEVRGLIINDRQGGNMMRALKGQSTANGSSTAFEWKDLRANRIGILFYEAYMKTKQSAK